MEPLKCFSCGTPISEVYELYIELKKVLVPQEGNQEKIFEILGFQRRCCRMHIAQAKHIHNFQLNI